MTALLLALALLDAGAAARAYAAERYEEAYALFQAALAEPGAAAGPLLFNLGNCAYRLGRHAEAVVCYRRALLRLPGDGQARFNLRLAEQPLGIEAPARENFGAAAVELADSLPPGTLLALAAGLQALGLVGLVLRRRRGPLRPVLVFLVLLGLAGGARLGQRQWWPGRPEGVVLARTIELRPEPHAGVAAVLTLRAGEIVRVEELSDRWLRVAHERGGGWTERGGVGVVE